MTKAERKLLQEKEAALFLEREQYIDWFGKDSSMVKRATNTWSAVYEVLELLDTEVDHTLPASIRAFALLRERQKLEAELATQIINK